MTSDETHNRDSDPVIEDLPEDDAAAEDVAYRPARRRREGGLGEIVKFGLLAVVLIITILVISLSRPLIFDRILPGVLGMNAAPATVRDIEPADGAGDDADAVDDAAGDDAAVDDADEATTAYPAGNDAAADAYPAGDDAYPAGSDTPTAVPTITYTVQVGDNLTKIAEQFNVTTAEIIAANNIVNPNRITVGTVLIIPQP